MVEAKTIARYEVRSSECFRFDEGKTTNSSVWMESLLGSYEGFPFSYFLRRLSDFAADNAAFIIKDRICSKCAAIDNDIEVELRSLLKSLDASGEKGSLDRIEEESHQAWNCRMKQQLKQQWGRWPRVYEDKPQLSRVNEMKFCCNEKRRKRNRK